MPRHGKHRSLGPVLFLALALGLASVLAYQAADAVRSHRETARRTLQDYASFASWQLAQHSKTTLLTTLVTGFMLPASRVDPANLQQSLVDPYDLAASVEATIGSCRCLGEVGFYFRYDWRDEVLQTTEPAVPMAVLEWTRDTIHSHVASLPQVSERTPLTFGSPGGGPLRELSVLLTNDAYAMVLGTHAGEPRMLNFVVSRDTLGQPLVVYGFETEPNAFLAPIFTSIRTRNSLLPPSLVRDVVEDSVMTVAVQAPDGSPLYSSAPARAFDPEFSAIEELPISFGRLSLMVSLRPELAPRLIVGGLPQSRLPSLLALLALTAGLLAVALRQLRRQQELIRLRTDFISGVSHELRTPLAQIRWFAELLRMGKLRTEAERDRSLRIIDQEARRLTYLVENVLSFARAEQGKSRVSPVMLDLEAEVRDALETFAPLARTREATLRTELEVGLVVRADSDALRQVLLNLLDNAAKYGPAGQEIIVGTAGQGSHVRFWVEDEGPGIPAGDHERVWEPYTRLERGAERTTGGSGIGLAVVRELVQLHEGRAWVEDGAHGGARIVIELHAVELPGDLPEDEENVAAATVPAP
ncbi:MAG: HAMP domain-containing histidine kinase [Gemmatimonadaceae bacterium]|nr:HAMP domain-containing histidine kinase [Gemmatimonadaceae bacterium]